MPLNILQQQFQTAIIHQDEEIETVINHGHIPLKARLQVYRDTVYGNLTGNLRLTFPIVEKIVGERFFKTMAAHYIENHLPKPGMLENYGDTFPKFIDNYVPAHQLPYLAEVAGFEWAMQLAYDAKSIAPLNVASLEKLSPDKLGHLKLKLQPAVQLIQTEYQVGEIWQFIQDGAANNNPDMAAGEYYYLINRTDYIVVWQKLTKAAFTFLNESQHGFGHAAEAAMERDDQFNLAQQIQAFLLQPIFVAIT